MRPMEPISNGRELALRLADQYPHQDWVAILAEGAGKSREFVEWQLQEGIQPSPDILSVAAEMLVPPESDDGEAGSGELLTADDLPFSGLPGNLGKLRQE